MARIRTTKPEFWTSEQIMECSPIARLLFIGMWNFCDDGGNHPASARTLKAEIFPSDDFTSSDVQRLIDELSSNNLITLYTSENKDYWHVNGWHHQKIDRPTFKYPQYSDDLSKPPRRTLGESSPPEGKGMEGIGNGRDVEGNGENRSSDTSTSVGASATEKTDDDKNLREPRSRHVEVAIFLRNLGVKPMTSMHPNCIEWAGNPKITDQLLTAAVETARQYKTEGDIHPNYLAPIVAELLLPKRDDNTWKRTHEGIERKGRELGLFANRNEDYPAFADRITKEIQKRKREGAPA
ncbi:hypothetical protein [Herminiimonas sp. KBW02]|uniref:hypothetical protein n=1 Tax=Herminiimonas sp. KBW02 TaxID=2153363 RepID=UPI0018F4C416|nr:hypothetical protein [Herminiimonas sp. KBW02]